MIQLHRTRSKTSVPAALRGASRRKRELALLTMRRDHVAAGGEKSPPWKQTYWKSSKNLLKMEAAGKCAYCESPTDVVAHGDVEHFRPKSVYWWLAYCLENYLFACQICNQSHKGDKFPIQGAQMAAPIVAVASTDAELEALVDTFAPDSLDVAIGYTLNAFVAECRSERAGLPNPYQEDPEPYFKWKADDVNKEVWLQPRNELARTVFIAESCDECFGINREELRRWRWSLAYDPLRRLKEILEELRLAGGPAKAIALTEQGIDDMMAPGRPYAGMVRYFVRELWALRP